MKHPQKHGCASRRGAPTAWLPALLAVLAALLPSALPHPARAQGDGGGADGDRDAYIRQLEKDMYRHYNASQTDSFTLVTERLKEACLEAGPREERLFYKAWANQAIYYFNHESRSKGLEVVHQEHDYAQQHLSKFGLYTSTYAIATMQTSLHRYEQAEKSFRVAIDYQHQYFPDESAAAPYLGLAKIYVNTHQYDKVRECARQALSEPGVIMQHQLSAWSYLCIAIYEDPNSHDDFNQAYAEREQVKEAFGHDDVFGDLVEIYHAFENGHTHEAMALAHQMKSRANSLNMISQTYAKLGDYKQAYDWYRRYKDYLDSVNTAEIQQLSYEYASQLDLSRAENEAKELRLSNQTVEIRAGIAILVLTLLFLGFYTYRRRKQLQRLRQAYEQLEATTTAKERIDSELRIARDIQMGMVPTTFPAFPHRKDIDIYASMVPAKAVGGDLYDFFLHDDALYFCVGDVSGKGVPASMAMAVAVNLFRTVAKGGYAPDQVATKLNATLSADNESGMFVTMFIGRIDLATGRLDFCNCGHCPPAIGTSTAANTFHFLPVESNAPIGLWPEMQFVGEHVDDVRGCTLFFYTDGISEAEDHTQQLFGDKRILRALNSTTQPIGERLPKSRSRHMVETVTRAVEAHVGDYEQSDDQTMLCIYVRPSLLVLRKRLTIRNEVGELHRVSAFVGDIGHELHLEGALLHNLELVMEEAVSNVIFYAHPEGTEAHITLTAESDGHELTFLLSDHGSEFDPTLKPDVDLDVDPAERELGGLGIFLVKNIMNEVSYQRVEGRNLLTMKKSIK